MFKVGDRVRIVRKVTDQKGWNGFWVSDMTDIMSKNLVYTIEYIDRCSIRFLEEGYYWPSDSLELVDDRKKISLSDFYRTQSGHTVKLFDILDDRVFGAVNYGGWIAFSWDEYGGAANSKFNLVKIGKYDHFKIDDQVIVWNDLSSLKRKRHFAGIDSDGKPMAWNDGKSSWNADDKTPWDNCELFVE